VKIRGTRKVNLFSILNWQQVYSEKLFHNIRRLRLMAKDFLKLLVYVAFFAVIIMHYGLPINIIRDLYITLRSFILKCKELYQYRMATHNMRERYPNATLEELEATDKLCIICREEMTILTEAEASSSPLVPKKLHCGHIYHFRCLRSWLERQQACPTCRRSVLESMVFF
jgi:E3 ubiquitin-protein ligase synoviolin